MRYPAGKCTTGPGSSGSLIHLCRLVTILAPWPFFWILNPHCSPLPSCPCRHPCPLAHSSSSSLAPLAQQPCPRPVICSVCCYSLLSWMVMWHPCLSLLGPSLLCRHPCSLTRQHPVALQSQHQMSSAQKELLPTIQADRCGPYGLPCPRNLASLGLTIHATGFRLALSASDWKAASPVPGMKQRCRRHASDS